MGLIIYTFLPGVYVVITNNATQSLIELDERLVTSLKNVLKYDNTFEVI